MLTLSNIESQEIREKIKIIQAVLPWANSMLCKNALSVSSFSVNGACILLSGMAISLSSIAEIPHRTSEIQSLPLYDLTRNSAFSMPDALFQASGSTYENKARVEKAVEIALPRNTVFGDLRETSPDTFDVQRDMRFSAFHNLGHKASLAGFTGSDHGHKQDLLHEGKHGETKHESGGSRKTNVSPTQQYFDSFFCNTLKRAVSLSSNLDCSTSWTVAAMISESFHTSQRDSGGFRWAIDHESHPFYRNERSTEERQRLEFTAAAVIRAACVIEPKQIFTRKGHEMWIVPFRDAQSRPFKIFSMSHGPFSGRQGTNPVNKKAYIGTNRGHFKPSPWISAQDSSKGGFLQAINVQGQYKDYSFEELRLGDYLRQRTRAPHLFSLFRKLPAELRLMVWKFTLTPRVVELRFSVEYSECWTPCAPPALLHVCRESRAEILKSCQLSFGLPNWQPRIYFDAERDTLFLTFEKDVADEWYSAFEVVGLVNALIMHNTEDVLKVQNLAVDVDLWDTWVANFDEELDFLEDDDDQAEYPMFGCLQYFRNLKIMNIVDNALVGYWKRRWESNYWDEDEFVSKDVEFIQAQETNSQYGNQGGRYTSVLKIIKDYDPCWSIPAVGILEKISKER